MPVQSEEKEKRNLRSLTITLAVSFLLLSALMLMITSGMFVYFSLQAQEGLIAEQQQLIAQKAADTVGGFIQEKFSILSAASSIGKMVAGNQEERKTELEKTLGVEPSFRQLLLMNGEGEVLESVSRLSESMSALVYDHMNVEDILFEVRQGKTYIGSVYVDRVTSEPMVIIAVPVKDVFGDFKGILAAETNLKFMWDMVDSLEIGRKGTAYVVDKEGKLLAFGDISRVLRGDSLMHLEEVKEFVEGDEETHVSSAETSLGIQGTKVVADHAQLENPDWAVVVELPVEEVYEHVNLEIMFSLLTVTVSIVMALLVAVYLSRRITRPIKSLRDAAEKIGAGKLDTKIEVITKNEIGELASAFNQMTIDLRKSKKELEEYSKELEKKVKERTAELEKSKKDLEATNYDLERFNRLAVGRELKMVELKKRIKELEGKMEKK